MRKFYRTGFIMQNGREGISAVGLADTGSVLSERLPAESG
jgi:hypothetical protein